ncbi:MAG: hypothetical protein NUV35_07680, partial [Syntrophomonadaceae bacterium]|nr:hypothetical protein [Syntrophomonadaceae bacterium]
MWGNLLLIFGLNVLSTGLGTLRGIFLARQVLRPVYVTTFLDALVFAWAFKLVAESAGLYYVAAFAAGKVAGVYLGNLVERRLALGLVEVTVYKHVPQGIELADRLREDGFSVTTQIGYGLEGRSRLVLSIVTQRAHLRQLQELLAAEGEPQTMAVKQVERVSGKMARRHRPAVLDGDGGAAGAGRAA